MPANGMRKELPTWALPVIIVVGLLFLAWGGWRALAGGNSSVGPDKAVRPGMYDLRAEVQKAQAQRQTQTENGSK